MEKPRIRVLSRPERDLVYITYQGCTLSASAWALKLGLSHKVVWRRLQEGLPLEEVFSAKKSLLNRRVELPPGETPETVLVKAMKMGVRFTGDDYLDLYGVEKRPWGSEDKEEDEE